MSEPEVFERIRDEIGKNDVLLFMKGTPVFPQCGFSAATVISEQFRGLSRVRQHQIVYAALRGRMGGELHALALQTSAPT